MGNTHQSTHKQNKKNFPKAYTSQGKGEKLRYAIAYTQGWRESMEDAHIDQPQFDHDTSLFAVFDGHGGAEVARFCRIHFCKELRKNQNYKEHCFEEALIETFIKMDELISSEEGQKELRKHMVIKTEKSEAGCTANVVLIHKSTLYVANAGDSRCLISSNGKLEQILYDHTTQLACEIDRIHYAGGFIYEGRVNGMINLTRAIGDLDFKKNPELPIEHQVISVIPDVAKRELNQHDEFILIGCDGVWELNDKQVIGDHVNEGLKKLHTNYQLGELEKIAQRVVEEGLSPEPDTINGCDNMSLILIVLNQ